MLNDASRSNNPNTMVLSQMQSVKDDAEISRRMQCDTPVLTMNAVVHDHQVSRHRNLESKSENRLQRERYIGWGFNSLIFADISVEENPDSSDMSAVWTGGMLATDTAWLDIVDFRSISTLAAYVKVSAIDWGVIATHAGAAYGSCGKLSIE